MSTGAAEVQQKDDAGAIVWTARATSSELTYADPGGVAGEFRGVSGRLYKAGKQASTFAARKGQARQRPQQLELQGAVVVRSLKDGAVLEADAIVWRHQSGVIEATGNVTVRSPDYTIGPFPRLLATPDLTTFGTPDAFK